MSGKSILIAAALMVSVIALQAQDKKYVTAKDLFYAELKSPAPEPPSPNKNAKQPVVPPSGQTAGKIPTPSNNTPSTGPNSGTAAKVIPARLDTPAKPSGKPGLRYELTQQMPDKREVGVDPESTFHSGDRVRFTFESSVDGYLYVMEEGSSGKWTVLFPNPDINQGTNKVRSGEKYLVPAKQQWFTFDKTPGTERLTVFLSKSPMQELPGFNSPITTIASLDRSVVDSLQGKVNTRDLVFEKEKPTVAANQTSFATYVVNAKENGTAILVSIALKHQ